MSCDVMTSHFQSVTLLLLTFDMKIIVYENIMVIGTIPAYTVRLCSVPLSLSGVASAAYTRLITVAYRVFLAPGARMGIGAPPFGVSDWQAQRRFPTLSGGGGGVWGGAPATNAFGTWEQLGVNGTHF